MEKLNCYSLNSLEEIANKVLITWNIIPKTFCRNLIDSFDKKIELLTERKSGNQYSKTF